MRAPRARSRCPGQRHRQARQLHQDQQAVAQQATSEMHPGAIVALIYASLSLIVLCISSYMVYKWNGEMTDEGKTTGCGWKSAACCILCFCTGCGTCLTICYPIDEAEKK